MNDLIRSLAPIIFVAVVVFATSVFVFLRSPGSVTVKFILVPASLAAACLIPLLFVALMGYSVHLQPPDKFFVIAHKTLVVKGKKKDIEIWTKEKDSTRLYIIPYTKELEEQLKAAEAGRQAGLEGRMTRRSKNKGFGQDDREDDDSSPYTIELLTPQQIEPKERGDEQPTPQQKDELVRKYTT